jgi:arabinose-5-phosphate isomerase
MSTDAMSSAEAYHPLEQLRFARQILRDEGTALLNLSERLGAEFCDAVELMFQCRGSVIVTGMGKAGLVGQKIVATLGSTGTPSHFMHPSEAVHGDLGRLRGDDVMLVLSYSGDTEEVTRLLPTFTDLKLPVIAITGRLSSKLGTAADVTLDLGRLEEACALGLAPSTSTTAMMALGDSLALVLSRMRRFRPIDFARFHPAGSLGRKLAKVEEVMRPLEECRVADVNRSIREVFVAVSRPGRRTGAVMLVDEEGRLKGLFTDSDLARLLEGKRDWAIDGPVSELMTANPQTITVGQPLTDAIAILSQRKISELPVVDSRSKPVGLIDITDVVALMPEKAGGENEGGEKAGGDSPQSLNSPPITLQAIQFPNRDGDDDVVEGSEL